MPSLCHKASPAREAMQSYPGMRPANFERAPQSTPQPPPERGCCCGSAALNRDNVWSIKLTNDPRMPALSSALKVLLGVFTLLFPSFGDGSGQERVCAGVECQWRVPLCPEPSKTLQGGDKLGPRAWLRTRQSNGESWSASEICVSGHHLFSERGCKCRS